MAGRITDLALLTAPDLDADLMELLDVSDISMAATGTNKKMTLRSLLTAANLGRKLYDHIADVGNVTTAETDLFTYTIPANTLTADKDSLSAFCSFAIIGSATETTQLKSYFAGTSRHDSGALGLAASGCWQGRSETVRTGTTTGRITVSLQTPGAALAVYSAQVDMTGLDWTATNVIKITGTRAGAAPATNDIKAKHGWVRYDKSS